MSADIKKSHLIGAKDVPRDVSEGKNVLANSIDL